MDKMTWRYATGICLLFLSGWSLATAKTEPKDHYASLLTPGARLLAGEPGKNEFFILAQDEEAPSAPAVKKLPQIRAKRVAEPAASVVHQLTSNAKPAPHKVAPPASVVHQLTSNTKSAPHKVHEQMANAFVAEKKVQAPKFASYEQAVKAFASDEKVLSSHHLVKNDINSKQQTASKKSHSPSHLAKKAFAAEKKVHVAKIKTKQTHKLATFVPVVKAFMPETKIHSPSHLAKKNKRDWASHEHIAKAFVPEKKTHLANKNSKSKFAWVSHQQLMNEFAEEKVIQSSRHLAKREVEQASDLYPENA